MAVIVTRAHQRHFTTHVTVTVLCRESHRILLYVFSSQTRPKDNKRRLSNATTMHRQTVLMLMSILA